MNMQKRSDERSIALHKEIAKKLRNNPNLWEIPKRNLRKWKKKRGKLPLAFVEWEYIFNKKDKDIKEQILSILEGVSEEAIRLRSSSPFTGILSNKERKSIFEYFKH